MSGKIVFDSVSVIDIANEKCNMDKVAGLTKANKSLVSVVTRIESLVSPKSLLEETKIRHFLKRCKTMGINPKIEREAIKLRQSAKLKLPDAIIAATAVVTGATLITRDNDLLKLDFPGLNTLSIE